MLVMSLFVFSPIFVLGGNWVVYVECICTKMRRPAGKTNLVAVLVDPAGSGGQSCLNAQCLGVQSGSGVLRTVHLAVDLLVAKVDRIGEVSSQRQVFVAGEALKALAMEDHFVDGSELLDLVHPLATPLTPRVVRHEEVLQTPWYVGVGVLSLLVLSVQAL